MLKISRPVIAAAFSPCQQGRPGVLAQVGGHILGALLGISRQALGIAGSLVSCSAGVGQVGGRRVQILAYVLGSALGLHKTL